MSVTGILLVLGSFTNGISQNPTERSRTIDYELSSDTYTIDLANGQKPELVWQEKVQIKDAAWLRLIFGNTQLGGNSYVLITSLKDGASQKLTADIMRQWENTSAYFNGEAVRVQLFASPFDPDVHVSIREVIINTPAPANPKRKTDDRNTTQTICGNDNRTPSDYKYVGRIMDPECTGWITSNGLLVTAGHCAVDMKGDGVDNIIEFNVPNSLNDGSPQHPEPEHQYKINEAYLVEGETFVEIDYGSGKLEDWAVFTVFNNSVTGLQPIQAQNASLEVVQTTFASQIKITGYGDDSGTADHLTQQSHSLNTSVTVNDFVEYYVDTQGGNSGSPIINENGKAIGVHTTGGCKNYGTSTNTTAFWNALHPSGSPQITLNQKRTLNSRIGGSSVGKWTGSSFDYYTIPSSGSLPTASASVADFTVLKGSQSLVTNPTEKYHHWEKDQNQLIDVRNYHEFYIYQNDDFSATSRFKNVSNADLTNSYAEAPTITPSNEEVLFKDPWLIDYADPQYGNALRNRGMQAPFKGVDASTSDNLGVSSNHKGIFLNESGAPDWTPPYYAVRAPQTVDFGGNIGTRPVYLLNWSADPTGDADFKHPDQRETPVVFNQAGVTVQSNLKISRVSDHAGAWNTNQRKIVRSANGWQHLVYASMGHIWYELKAPGGTWQLADANGTQPHQDQGGGRGPALDYLEWPAGNPRTALVWQQGDQIRLQTFYYDGSTYQYGPAKTYASGEPSSYSATPNVAWARGTRISHQEIFSSARRS